MTDTRIEFLTARIASAEASLGRARAALNLPATSPYESKLVKGRWVRMHPAHSSINLCNRVIEDAKTELAKLAA